MGNVVTLSRRVRRPAADVADFVTDPHRLFPVIPGFARFRPVSTDAELGTETWDVFLDVGSYHVGGRVALTRPDDHTLAWTSLRGTRHHFALTVEPDPDDAAASTLSMSLGFHLSGLLVAKAASLLAKGIVTRHLEAGLEELRHHLEFVV